MSDRPVPLFSDRQAFTERAEAAGLTAETCGYVAATELVHDLYGGIDISDRDFVKANFEDIGHRPFGVEVNGAADAMDMNADIACGGCKMLVRIRGGLQDFQQVILLKTQPRNCPIFEEKPKQSEVSHGVDNRVMYGVSNTEFERAGAGPAERYEGDDGLIGSVAKAAKIVLLARQRQAHVSQLERAETLLRSRVERLFNELASDDEAIRRATGLVLDGKTISYNSLHISIRNPDYIPPVSTREHNPNGSVSIRTNWTGAQGKEFLDVTIEEILTNPKLGTELVVHNAFHL